MGDKQPLSVLVLVHTLDLRVLLLERTSPAGMWQSVTGSREGTETPVATALRELREETGIDADPAALVDWKLSSRYRIFPQWRHRYPVGVAHNTEHLFSLPLPEPVSVRLSPEEHVAYRWLPWREAAAACFSWSNRDAILMLGLRTRPEAP